MRNLHPAVSVKKIDSANFVDAEKDRGGSELPSTALKSQNLKITEYAGQYSDRGSTKSSYKEWTEPEHKLC